MLFPNDTTLFERLDATATYKFDPVWVRSMGFNGDLKAKLRYTWERHGVNNWQNEKRIASSSGRDWWRSGLVSSLKLLCYAGALRS
jgi:hypothetical protein